METTYLKLDYDRIEKDYSISLRKFVQWMASKEDIIQGLGAMEGNAGKYKRESNELYQIVGQIVPPIIQHDPRKLYEFFDEYKIIISVSLHPDSDENHPTFTYHNSVIKESKVSPNRHMAEMNAFYDAFGVMERGIQAMIARNNEKLEKEAEEEADKNDTHVKTDNSSI